MVFLLIGTHLGPQLCEGLASSLHLICDSCLKVLGSCQQSRSRVKNGTKHPVRFPVSSAVFIIQLCGQYGGSSGLRRGCDKRRMMLEAAGVEPENHVENTQLIDWRNARKEHEFQDCLVCCTVAIRKLLKLPDSTFGRPNMRLDKDTDFLREGRSESEFLCDLAEPPVPGPNVFRFRTGRSRPDFCSRFSAAWLPLS